MYDIAARPRRAADPGRYDVHLDDLASNTRPGARPQHFGMPVRCTRGRTAARLPCQRHDPDLWFAEDPTDLERAKMLCADCPARSPCLAGAIERAEHTGVWGGEIFDHGQIVSHKRPRGRPPNNSVPPRRQPLPAAARMSGPHPVPSPGHHPRRTVPHSKGDTP